MATNRIKAIRDYFQQQDPQAPDGGRKVTMDELKGLTAEDKDELGVLCASALGEELEQKAA
jgi:hypothetical protein